MKKKYKLKEDMAVSGFGGAEGDCRYERDNSQTHLEESRVDKSGRLS